MRWHFSEQYADEGRSERVEMSRFLIGGALLALMTVAVHAEAPLVA
jgi:hypothetical protein